MDNSMSQAIGAYGRYGYKIGGHTSRSTDNSSHRLKP